MLKFYKTLENWAKDHPFLLLPISYPVVELIKFFHDEIKGVDYSSLLGYVVTFLNIDFNVKSWHILALSVFLFLFIFVRSKLKSRQLKNIKRDIRGEITTLNSSTIHLAEHPYDASLSSEILKNKNGIFSIWGQVAD